MEPKAKENSDSELKQFVCWKCDYLLLLYKKEISIVISCSKCHSENRAGVGPQKTPSLN